MARRASEGDGFRGRRRSRRPLAEVLEDRRLLTASLQPIADFSVPAQQGYTLPLDGSGTTDDQTFTVTQTSGDANITASVATGPFWTLNTSYTDPSNSANDFSGQLTFQLFQTLTPNTVSQIEQYTNDGYYDNTNFIRIASGFPGKTDDIVQGGTTTANESSASGQTGTPFLNENVQQLAFTGQDQLAMANAGVNTNLPDSTQGVNTNDTQFFVTTTGSPNSVLGYGYTIFGQLVAGVDTLTQVTQVPLQDQTNPGYNNEHSEPVNPVDMTSASLSDGNPNGVLLIDTTQATAGESATFMVTATDPTDGSTVSQSFTVTVGAYAGPTDPAIDFKPLASPVTATAPGGKATAVTLTGKDGYPDKTKTGTLTYSLVSQPSDGTITNFDATTGTFDYTPNPGFTGTDTFQYEVQELGPAPPISSSENGPAVTTTSDPTTVTITDTPTAPTITWAMPSSIPYGTALSATQLDATTTVPGTFTYSPPAGTILPLGSNQTLSVSFTPTDSVDYSDASGSTTIDVTQGTPTITWAKPSNIVYGTAIGAAQLDATASVAGTFTYSTTAGTILDPGNGWTLSVSFKPTDTTDYTTASDATSISVEHATPTITWAAPASIAYGTALTAAQLDATASWTVGGVAGSVAGTFTYSPAMGTVLQPGSHTLSVIFTPTDTTDYTTASGTTTVEVTKATPTITWAAPASIVYGTALTEAQLDATASVPGTFTYSPPPGTVLAAGNNQTLSVTFTPTNSADYTTASDGTTINVTPKTVSTGGSPTPTPTPTPLVTIAGVQLDKNKKGQVTEIVLTLSGPVDAAEAVSTATYHLATAGKNGSFTAKNAQVIKLSSAGYDGANDTIALVPKKPIALSKSVQLVVYGGASSGLQDSLGRYIDGNHDGQAGGDAVGILSRSGASIDAVAMGAPPLSSISAMNAIDVLLAQSASDGLVHHSAARKLRG